MPTGFSVPRININTKDTVIFASRAWQTSRKKGQFARFLFRTALVTGYRNIAKKRGASLIIGVYRFLLPNKTNMKTEASRGAVPLPIASEAQAKSS